ncbi:hypothetical protein MAHJHV61_37070 [Mycobacterium avium subsp. hominissuis]|uniref:hypothetical protein n=1 Tax=Mycobacterium avium TaxID=1764 RepID=UPI000A052874|nr:hypothetical protein [Mycobacterium avium]
MADETTGTRAALAVVDALDRAVAESRFGRAREWGGADVGIVSRKPPEPQGPGFYPPPRYVVTEHSHELSWLFEELWKPEVRVIFGPVKEEFFGRLANAANRYLNRTDNPTPRDLLGAVIHEAYVCLEAVEDGTFRALLVAPGNEIYDDWVDDSDRDDYMTVEETAQWFAERGIG